MQITDLNLDELLLPLETMADCTWCPRECHADRFGDHLGYCNSGAGFNISSICVHHGEEPVISGNRGICNIFFSHCNMQCIYCQNYQISRNTHSEQGRIMTLDEVLAQCLNILDQGAGAVGFVSPSHHVPHVMVIIRALRLLGRNPVFVYNTNAYDKVETIRLLDGWIDVYLPDLKYMIPGLAESLSDTPHYPEIAAAAVREMYRQKGSTLITNHEGYAASGLIIRHLVLPGQIENSLNVLRFIAEEASAKVNVSLMAQYGPVRDTADHPFLGRTLLPAEYSAVLNEMERLGLYRGWIQELSSSMEYRPDFMRADPFVP
ncbi:MAG: hypothetical protein JW861_02620 [Bacteroidales bacterium]|nr:hypothetical protein [Bacteroidales bacterium]